MTKITPPEGPVPEPLVRIIERLECDLLEPQVRRSPERLNELLDDEFVEFGASGKRYTKQEIVHRLPDSVIVKYSVRDLRILQVRSDVMLATYLVEKETPGINTKAISLRSSLWRNRNGRWQMVFHQGTPVHEVGGVIAPR
jgi:hypothetical protein